jgi:hypothetical protein
MIEEAQERVTQHTKELAITREPTGMKAVKLSYPVGINDKSSMPVNGSLQPPQRDRYPLRWVSTNDTM